MSKKKDYGLDKHCFGIPLLSLNCILVFCKMVEVQRKWFWLLRRDKNDHKYLDMLALRLASQHRCQQKVW